MPPPNPDLFQRFHNTERRAKSLQNALLDASKNWLFLMTNRPLLGLGEAGDVQWRDKRDFSIATSG